MHFGKRFSTSNASRASSTDTLTSVTSTNTAVSTSTLAPSKQGRAEKDYLAAQGALQSAYGFGGAAPVIPTVSSSPKTKKHSTAPSQTSTATNSRPAKDWEAAYATLSSQYGFGGAAPMVPTVPKSSK